MAEEETQEVATDISSGDTGQTEQSIELNDPQDQVDNVDEPVVSQDSSSNDEVKTESEQSAPDEGQAQEPNSQESKFLTDLAAKNGWSKEEAAEQAAKMAVNLESKLGNYKEVEAKAALYEQVLPLLQNPTIQKAIQPAEPEPDYENMSPEQIIDTRAEAKAKALIDSRMKELESKFMPFVQDYNMKSADEAIREVRSQFPGFDKLAPQINEYIKQRPGMAYDKNTLIDVYKILDYENVKKAGEQEAYAKLRSKQQISRTTKPSGASTTPGEYDSWDQAFADAKAGR